MTLLSEVRPEPSLTTGKQQLVCRGPSYLHPRVAWLASADRAHLLYQPISGRNVSRHKHPREATGPRDTGRCPADGSQLTLRPCAPRPAAIDETQGERAGWLHATTTSSLSSWRWTSCVAPCHPLAGP